MLMQKLIETGEKVYAEALFAVKNKGDEKNSEVRSMEKNFLYLLTIERWNEYPPDLR